MTEILVEISGQPADMSSRPPAAGRAEGCMDGATSSTDQLEVIKKSPISRKTMSASRPTVISKLSKAGPQAFQRSPIVRPTIVRRRICKPSPKSGKLVLIIDKGSPIRPRTLGRVRLGPVEQHGRGYTPLGGGLAVGAMAVARAMALAMARAGPKNANRFRTPGTCVRLV